MDGRSAGISVWVTRGPTVLRLERNDILSNQIATQLGRGFLCETLMPEREDVASCVDVAVMHRAAVAANPRSHSKTCSTFRTARRDEPAAQYAVDRKRFDSKNRADNRFKGAVCKIEMDTLDICGCRRRTTCLPCSPSGFAASSARHAPARRPMASGSKRTRHTTGRMQR